MSAECLQARVFLIMSAECLQARVPLHPGASRVPAARPSVVLS